MNGMIKKAGLAIALAATAATVAVPAEAQRFGGGYHGGYGGYHGGYGGYRGYHGGYRGGNIAGAAVIGGLVGLGVGAAIADSHRGYYGGGYYGAPYRGYGYYGAPYGYGYGYYGPHCWNQWRFDPYWGRNVRVRVCN